MMSTSCAFTRALAVLAALVLAAAPAVAQTEATLASARALAADERYEDAIALLENHLAGAAGDVDARLVYGLVLSWDARYPDARVQFEQVLAVAPGYTDARMGLANVEWWAGNIDRARGLVDEILAAEPGHSAARQLRQRLNATDRPWGIGLSWGYDHFDDGRNAWESQAISLSRETLVGTVTVRGSRAERFGLDDAQVEVEFYPTLRAGTYAAIGVGYAPDGLLFPERRLTLELYQALGRGFEVSAGFRKLRFVDSTDIYAASLTKYIGNWMATARVSHVPSTTGKEATSIHADVRRYFGSEGTSFVGLGYGHGLWREEVRSTGDLLSLDSNTMRAQVDAAVSQRTNFQVNVGASRQGSIVARVWQFSLGAGIGFRF